MSNSGLPSIVLTSAGGGDFGFQQFANGNPTINATSAFLPPTVLFQPAAEFVAAAAGLERPTPRHLDQTFTTLQAVNSSSVVGFPPSSPNFTFNTGLVGFQPVARVDTPRVSYSTSGNPNDAANDVHDFGPQMTAIYAPPQPHASIGVAFDPRAHLHASTATSADAVDSTTYETADGETQPKKKFISPFSPEATVPLPCQLDELGNMGTTVWRRNERERYRVRCVNEGYVQLRNHLPLTECEKRLSKVDTLRLAILYIRHLELLIQNMNHELECGCFLNFTPSGPS